MGTLFSHPYIEPPLRITSWNVNGLRAVMKKDFLASVEKMDADVLEGLDGYHIYSNSAVRKGYSGVAILSREVPLAVRADIGIEEHDQEGRVLTAEFADYYLLTVYTPNSGNELKRRPGNGIFSLSSGSSRNTNRY